MNENDTSVCIAVKWIPYYGFCERGERNLLLMNYLKCKYFILHLSEIDNDDIGVGFGPTDIINDYEYYINMCGLSSSRTKIMVGKPYTFNDRLFCNVNYSFNRFIKKCKNYYKNKLKYYKGPRNILKRQLMGRY
tara:strand:- start:237 stop:638 length:402 start_codon:yes stop_codon:yes gene_type:complete